VTHVVGEPAAVVLRGVQDYDNETGTGDHRHVSDVDASYSFSSYETLLADFWADVDAWRQRR